MSAAHAENIIKLSRNAGTTETISLGLDKSLVLELPDAAADILVANPEVADAVTRTSRRIYLFGKKVGTTNIFIFDESGNQLANLDLSVERDVAGLDAHIERFIPGSNIKTEIINDNIVLTGEVQTTQDASRAAQLADLFVNGGQATGEDVSIFTRVRESKIINLLNIIGGDQVTVKVTVAEVQRSVVKQLGVNLAASKSGSNGIVFDAVSAGIAGAYGKPLTGTSSALLGGTIGGMDINAVLNAMENAGVMRTLASPTLTAVSGEKAVFKVGGEYNLVRSSTADEDGITYTVEQLEYGVGLEVTPVVLSPGRISLRIRTSVSEPTVEGSQSLSIGQRGMGTGILSIRKRLADTAVELPSGGSMVIAGLIRDDVRTVVNGFPGLSKVPVLGSLFRSRDFVRNETELVILVTPYLVRPVAESQIALPTDNLSPASDSAANLLGRVNRLYGSAKTNKPDGRYHGTVGFIFK
ncbi:MAG: type II and III secretion system protein family protein [Pseudomonadota bacterium]